MPTVLRQKWPSGSHACWCGYVGESRYGFLCMIYNRTACGVSPGLWRGSISAKSCFIILHLVISLLMYHLLAVCLNLMPLLPFILFCSPFLSACLQTAALTLARSNQLDSQVSTLGFPLPASLPSSARCLPLFSKRDRWTFSPN